MQSKLRNLVSICSKGSLATFCSFCINLKRISLTLPLILLSGLTSALYPTISYAQVKAYSHEDLDVQIGQAIFEKLWVFAPSSTKSSDGLGPFYNARSCHQCHDESKKTSNEYPPSLIIQLSIEPIETFNNKNANIQSIKEHGFIPEPTYGKQIQTFSYPGAKSEAVIKTTTSTHSVNFSDGDSTTLRKYDYHIEDLAYGALHPDTKYSPRVAPRMLGLGLLELIPDKDIVALSDPNDTNQDGISGKVNTVWNPQQSAYGVGRFGWKATKATLDQQNLAALSTDIGISSWLFPKPEGDCTNAQMECVKLAKTTETHLSNVSPDNHQTEAEASQDMTKLLLAFTRAMNNKSKKNTNKELSAELKEGQTLFSQVGCHGCHQRSFHITETDENGMMTRHQIAPYTDLLLHDMGQALADNRREFKANGQEWRTAPLWGIASYLKRTDSPHFLHDGRASSILEAILWHGGEAENSKQSFMNLNRVQRKRLIKFVESL